MKKQVYLLWEVQMGAVLEAVITDRGLAQKWADSSDWRAFTTENVDSKAKLEVIEMKLANSGGYVSSAGVV